MTRSFGLIAGLLAVAVFGLTACTYAPAEGPSRLGVLPAQAAKPLWSGTLQPIDDQTVTGTIAIVPGEKVNSGYALISIESAEPGHVYGWSIRTGTCNTSGVSLIQANGDPSLEVLADGTANAEFPIPQRMDSKSAYSAVVTESTTDTTQVACGTLELRSM